MKKIFTEQGDDILVDDEDFEFISRFRFRTSLIKNIKRPYAFFGKSTTRFGIEPSYLVMGHSREGLVLDHINRDPFDNRRINLRFVTLQQNNMNRKKSDSPKFTSKYKGVCKVPGCKNRWQARIKFNGFTNYLGSFGSSEEAALAYDKKAKELFGEFAFLNFPEKHQ